MRSLPDAKLNDILALLDQGLPGRKIAQQTGVSHITVNRMRDEFRKSAEKSRGGRPRVLTPTDRRNVARIVAIGKAKNAVIATKLLKSDTGIKVGMDTVRRALKNARMRAIVKQKKPRFLSRHMKSRLAFARKYQQRTIDDWKRVIWSDETKINRLGSDGREYAWIVNGRDRSQQHYKGTVKFGGGNLMLWGCMTAKGVGL